MVVSPLRPSDVQHLMFWVVACMLRGRSLEQSLEHSARSARCAAPVAALRLPPPPELPAAQEIYKEGTAKELLYDLVNVPARCKLDREYSDASYPWKEVHNAEDMLEQLAHGAANRNIDRTGGNARSFRSHAIFTVRLQRSGAGAGADGRAVHTSGRFMLVDLAVLTRGRFMLVDLAGAENASASDAGSVTQRQGAGINVGLGTLQQVIQDVARPGSSAKYHDSKLTFLLKPGRCRRAGCLLCRIRLHVLAAEHA
jgi:hypothetical protein